MKQYWYSTFKFFILLNGITFAISSLFDLRYLDVMFFVAISAIIRYFPTGLTPLLFSAILVLLSNVVIATFYY